MLNIINALNHFNFSYILCLMWAYLGAYKLFLKKREKDILLVAIFICLSFDDAVLGFGVVDYFDCLVKKRIAGYVDFG
jgi:hypothetical protein